jgi:hypothetical protein
MRYSTIPSTFQKTFNQSKTSNRILAAKLNQSSPIRQSRKMSTGLPSIVTAAQNGELISVLVDANIENTNIKTASGVSLDDHQKTLVGSVLDVSIPIILSIDLVD